jgi:hypothetical protein
MSIIALLSALRFKPNPPSSGGPVSCCSGPEKPYRNLYQTVTCRNMSQYAGIGFFLGRSQKSTPKTGEGSPIPTLASNFRNRNNLHAITVDSSSLLSKWARNESRPSPFVVSLRHDSLCKLLPQERVLRRSPISEKTNSKLALTILT